MYEMSIRPSNVDCRICFSIPSLRLYLVVDVEFTYRSDCS
jgi:hypothetical protein